MRGRIEKRSLLLVFLLGIIVGILAQRYHLAGTLLRQASALLQGERIAGDEDADDNAQTIALKVRDFQQAVDPAGFDTEQDGREVYQVEEIPLSQLALILIDVWADHPNDGWKEREEININVALVPLLRAAREHGILIVHSPHGRSIHELAAPLPDEVVVNGPNEQLDLLRVLRRRGITHLLYAGYASNMCILN
ncbi:MAG: hypothetical protein QXI12_09610 [Candidatus Methanomethyliaceae archaeon]